MPTGRIVEDERELEEIVRSARTVAVVGIKDGSDPLAPAYAVPKELLARGLKVIAVNPTISTALGQTAYPDLASIPAPPDIVDVFRRSDAVEQHADQVLALPPEKRPSVFWMQTGIRNDGAADELAAAGIRVVMDRCLGVYAKRYRERV